MVTMPYRRWRFFPACQSPPQWVYELAAIFASRRVESEHRTIKLPDGLGFFAWAHEQWPPPRWSIELDPWELAPAWPR